MPRFPTDERQKERRALGERLLLLRRRTDKSQADVAARLGVSQGAVSDWELGKSEPQLLDAKLLSQVYGVGIDVLLGDAPLPPH